MTFKLIRIIILLSLAAGILLLHTSCKTASREEKYYEKLEKRMAMEEEKEFQAKLKEHKKMQSEQTLKMMRDMERQSKKLNKSRKR